MCSTCTYQILIFLMLTLGQIRYFIGFKSNMFFESAYFSRNLNFNMKLSLLPNPSFSTYFKITYSKNTVINVIDIFIIDS